MNPTDLDRIIPFMRAVTEGRVVEMSIDGCPLWQKVTMEQIVRCPGWCFRIVEPPKPLERQRIALAEWDGFRWYRMPKHPSDSKRHRTLFLPLVHEYEGQSPEWLERADGSESMANWEYMEKEGFVPDYLNDLNAVSRLENRLDVNQLSAYADALDKVCVEMHVCPLTHWQAIALATAPQRCEALLRTLGLWEGA